MNDFSEFLGALDEAITKFVESLKEALGTANEMIQKLKDEIYERSAEIFDRRSEHKKRREAALLAGQRATARAKVYGLRMQLEKARQALRRRKRLHDDSGLPDW